MEVCKWSMHSLRPLLLLSALKDFGRARGTSISEQSSAQISETLSDPGDIAQKFLATENFYHQDTLGIQRTAHLASFLAAAVRLLAGARRGGGGGAPCAVAGLAPRRCASVRSEACRRHDARLGPACRAAAHPTRRAPRAGAACSCPLRR